MEQRKKRARHASDDADVRVPCHLCGKQRRAHTLAPAWPEAGNAQPACRRCRAAFARGLIPRVARRTPPALAAAVREHPTGAAFFVSPSGAVVAAGPPPADAARHAAIVRLNAAEFAEGGAYGEPERRPADASAGADADADAAIHAAHDAWRDRMLARTGLARNPAATGAAVVRRLFVDLAGACQAAFPAAADGRADEAYAQCTELREAVDAHARLSAATRALFADLALQYY